MPRVTDLPTPALLLDLDKLDANLRRMAERTERLGVALRPHVKTHKCVEIARRQQALGCRGLTVSTLEEAELFAAAGFDDLTWAFPLILGRLDEVADVAGEATLRLTVDSDEAIDALEAAGLRSHVWLKVDCGYHRAGVDPESRPAAELARRLAASPRLRFDGLLTHSGQAYHTDSRAALEAAAREEREVMVRFAERLRSEGVEVPAVSIGSTPAMSVVEDLTGVDEARPGNYVFYDYGQTRLGSCEVGDCALTLLASVVSRQPGHAVIDAGALALSMDDGVDDPARASYGEIFEDYPAARLSTTTRVRSLSQEHGIVTRPLPVGSQVRVLVNHSCLTVACFDAYTVVRGEEVVGRWPIERRRSRPMADPNPL